MSKGLTRNVHSMEAYIVNKMDKMDKTSGKPKQSLPRMNKTDEKHLANLIMWVKED